jgi:hypothetical protein
MNFKKMFKRETKVMAYIVICLTIVVLGASYALFFQVKDNTKHQYVNAGSLVIEYSDGNQVDASNNCLTPQSDTDAVKGGCTFNLSIRNTGSLPMQYNLLIYNGDATTTDSEETTDTSSTQYVSNDLIRFTLKKQYTVADTSQETSVKTIANLGDYTDTDGGKTIVKKIIETSTIDAGETIVFSLNIWLDENADTDIIGQYVSLALDVKGTVYENDDATETLVSNMDVNGLSEVISDTEAATSETTTIKEYRFTGSNPLNYVYFNCNESTDTTDADTTANSCEVWRIIGIYNVDGVSRMKIVNADYEGTSAWNDNTENTFETSTLNEYLTSYYENLSDIAKGQIEEATYYLGGADSLDINSKALYGSEKSSSTKTKVGIMSLSDYTFANGTNSDTNISDLIITSDNNWLYKLEDEWFINKNTSNEIYTAVPTNLEDEEGTAVITISTSADASSEKLIRPVVYLASNIKILDADSTNENAYGSINNPYVLSK